jgi:hypothetical protein
MSGERSFESPSTRLRILREPQDERGVGQGWGPDPQVGGNRALALWESMAAPLRTGLRPPQHDTVLPPAF